MRRPGPCSHNPRIQAKTQDPRPARGLPTPRRLTPPSRGPFRPRPARQRTRPPRALRAFQARAPDRESTEERVIALRDLLHRRASTRATLAAGRRGRRGRRVARGRGGARGGDLRGARRHGRSARRPPASAGRRGAHALQGRCARRRRAARRGGAARRDQRPRARACGRRWSQASNSNSWSASQARHGRVDDEAAWSAARARAYRDREGVGRLGGRRAGARKRRRRRRRDRGRSACRHAVLDEDHREHGDDDPVPQLEVQERAAGPAALDVEAREDPAVTARRRGRARLGRRHVRKRTAGRLRPGALAARRDRVAAEAREDRAARAAPRARPRRGRAAPARARLG